MAGFTSAPAAAPPPEPPGAAPRTADDDRLSSLGDEINNRLFRVGLDVCSALGLAKDEAVRVRLELVVAELDGAIKDLRQLVLIVLAAQADPRSSRGNGGACLLGGGGGRRPAA